MLVIPLKLVKPLQYNLILNEDLHLLHIQTFHLLNNQCSKALLLPLKTHKPVILHHNNFKMLHLHKFKANNCRVQLIKWAEHHNRINPNLLNISSQHKCILQFNLHSNLHLRLLLNNNNQPKQYSLITVLKPFQ
jgi:hypothetical protein